ncbi:ComEA family DNA-binding protein [Cellulosimicrobium composti]|uniref:ComEA family DNA-binding protein n=1 Tax=Cellulosimicrobium composti TaxID=2672572 RepID=UPI00298EA2B5|nr:ComEA family DNA-binding protein [Cellulosimicrobium composti]
MTGTGRPALAWHPATAALPSVDPRDAARGTTRRAPWDEVLGPAGPDVVGPAVSDDLGAGPSGGEESVGVVGDEADGTGRARDEGGWLPSRPGGGGRGPVDDAGVRDDPRPSDETGSHDVPERRSVLGRPAPARPDPGEELATAPGDDAAARLRHRATRTAASAYTAAHGHPTSHAGFADLADDGGRPRWGLRPRTAVAALVAVLVLAAAVVLLRAPAGGVEPVATLGAPQTGGESGAGADDAADPVAGDGATEAPVTSTDGTTGAGAAGGADAGTGPSSGVVVHVVGQVATPGLVTVGAHARVAEAIEAAGGATAEADLAALNLARTVTDGEQIHVPRPGEAVPAAAAAPAHGSAGTPGGPLDLNTADVAALDALPGIGPVLAERIVAWREENGPFTAVDELGEVSGIGPAVLADVRDLVRV